jgi:hypothetical protein
MTVTRVRQAFEVALNTWAAARTPALPVAWANVPFTPTASRHARAHLMPAPTTNEMLSGKHRRYEGIFQVSLYVPEGSGDAEARTLADSLDTVFSPSSPLTNGGLKVYLTQPVSQTQGINEDGWYRLHASAAYRADEVVS